MGILDLFKKKKPENMFAPMPSYPSQAPLPPIEAVKRGAPAPEMLERAEVPGALPVGIPPGMPPPPPPPARPLPELVPKRTEPRKLLTEDIEAIAESVVSEKMKMLENNFANIDKWRIKIEKNITALKDETKNIESEIKALEKNMSKKIDDYSKGVSDISAEIQAIQKVFKATLPEFTYKVKELSSLVEKFKSKSVRKKATKRKTKKAVKKKTTKRKKK